ncbi:salicylate hydroxylase [Colletotrichum incanum]|uniref:Salicylate hydroxylase n=1 Tax=Colletotrichum incanum TaxID=1573173 RepID=A0A166LTF8_COLIC|nr:salicylate hydroxylase [Colletotrichum incanum]
MANILQDVAIIGAGLGGALLALRLHQESVPCRIYEAKHESSSTIVSGVSLTPNGCRVLDLVGALDRVRPQCYQTEHHSLMNGEGHIIKKPNVAPEELFSYKIHRIYRAALMQELTAMLKERNIPIEYGAKFEQVVEDNTDGVKFLVGGRTQRASLLIGADGIYSTVRKHLAAQLPEYTGVACIYGHVSTHSIPWPSDSFEKSGTIQDKPGALFMIPEVPDGSDLMVGRQFYYPSLDRLEWEALATDSEQLYDLLCEDYDQWQPLVKSIFNQLSKDKEALLLWPFYRVPKLERWASPTGRVIIIGDAAHAMPPSSGQGVNQAFEDAHTLVLLLTSLLPETDTIDLKFSCIDAGIQVPPNGTRVARQLGYLDKLIEDGVALDVIELRRYANGKILYTRTVKDCDAKYEVKNIDVKKNSVILEDGEVVGGDVIIEADGLYSTFRDLLLGSPSPAVETVELAYRSTLTLDSLKALDDPLVDELCIRKQVTVRLGPGKHAVSYPVRGGREFNIVLFSLDNLGPGMRRVEGKIEEMWESYKGWDET